jgi:hypothetical protein
MALGEAQAEDFSNDLRAALLLTAASDAAFESAIGRSGQSGDTYYSTVDKVLRYHNGSSYTNVANPTLSNWMSGLCISSVQGDAGHLKIAVGGCLSSDGAQDLVIEREISIKNTPWASYGGALTLDTGSMAANTWYYVFLIGKPTGTGEKSSGSCTSTSASHLVDSGATFSTDGVVAGDAVVNTTTGEWSKVATVNSETDLTLRDDIFTSGDDYEVSPAVIAIYSASSSSPTLPTGYTKKRRLGALRSRTDSNYFLDMYQIGAERDKKTIYTARTTDNKVLDTATVVTWTDLSLAAAVPPTSQYAVLAGMTKLEAYNSLWRRNGLSVTYGYRLRSSKAGSATASFGYAQFELATDSSQVVEYSLPAAKDLVVYVDGYHEEL